MLTECPILTAIGVRVPDVARASREFLAAHGETTPFPGAPEICVEIVSPSNSEQEMRGKTQACLAAGAREVWLACENGAVHYFDAGGERPSGAFAIRVSPPPPVARA